MLRVLTEVLSKGLLMSVHNICFCGEITKILCGYTLLSGAVYKTKDTWNTIPYCGSNVV